jgi:hypothetical protein
MQQAQVGRLVRGMQVAMVQALDTDLQAVAVLAPLAEMGQPVMQAVAGLELHRLLQALQLYVLAVAAVEVDLIFL